MTPPLVIEQPRERVGCLRCRRRRRYWQRLTPPHPAEALASRLLFYPRRPEPVLILEHVRSHLITLQTSAMMAAIPTGMIHNPETESSTLHATIGMTPDTTRAPIAIIGFDIEGSCCRLSLVIWHILLTRSIGAAISDRAT